MLIGLGIVSHAQVSNPPLTPTSVAPSGSCGATSTQLLTPNGMIYTCQGGAWGIASGGSGANGNVGSISQRAPTLTDDAAHGASLTNTPIWINTATGDTFKLIAATPNGSASWARLQPSYALPLDVAGANVQAGYSTCLIRQAYAGNAMTITRASDSTTQALGFVQVPPYANVKCFDTALAAKFCAGTTCRATTFNDQQGGTKDCTQATFASAPLVLFDTLGNWATITFDGVVATEFCTMPAGVAVTNPNLSIIAVAQPKRLTAIQAMINLGPNSGNQFGLWNFVNGSTQKTPVIVGNDPFANLGTTPAEDGPAVYAAIQSSSFASWVNETSSTASLSGNTSAFTGGQIGEEGAFGTAYNGNISTVIIKSTALSATERTNVFNALYRLHGIGPQYAENNLVTLGDSITAGPGAGDGPGWAYLLGKQLNMRLVNDGTAGTKCSDMDTNFATFTAPLLYSTSRNNVLTLMCGTNDLIAGFTASAVITSQQSIVAKAAAAGFTVLVATILPVPPGSFETQRTTINAAIRAGYPGASGVIDFAGSSVMGQAGQNTNSTYYNADNEHPNQLGNEVLAQISLPVVAGALNR